MGLVRSLFGGSSVIEVMRLGIIMDYMVSLQEGCAAIRWDLPNTGNRPYHEGIEGVQATLIALLYGRILSIHDETKSELFSRVNNLAIQVVRTEGATGFEFENWILEPGMGAGSHRLWPWTLGNPEQIKGGKTYSAILQAGKPTKKAPAGRWLYLGMALGLERILAPSSALIGLNSFSKTCTQESRYFLGLLLWQMNAYWRAPALIPPCSEAVAYAAADSAIRSGQLAAP